MVLMRDSKRIIQEWIMRRVFTFGSGHWIVLPTLIAPRTLFMASARFCLEDRTTSGSIRRPLAVDKISRLRKTLVMTRNTVSFVIARRLIFGW